jgi:hypothetical protein
VLSFLNLVRQIKQASPFSQVCFSFAYFYDSVVTAFGRFIPPENDAVGIRNDDDNRASSDDESRLSTLFAPKRDPLVSCSSRKLEKLIANRGFIRESSFDYSSKVTGKPGYDSESEHDSSSSS